MEDGRTTPISSISSLNQKSTIELKHNPHKDGEVESKDRAKRAPQPAKEEISESKEEFRDSLKINRVSKGESVEVKDSSKKERPKKLLIAKKFPLTTKILSTLIKSLGIDYDVLQPHENLLEKIDNNLYDIIFIDDEFLNREILEKVREKNIALVLSEEPKNRLIMKRASVYIIKHLASNKEIKELIEQIRDENEI